MAVDYYETLGQEDLNIGTSTFQSRNPGGGSLTSTQIGLHSFARNQLKTTATWDPGSVSSGGNASTTVTVTGATLGDFVLASFNLDLQGLQMSAYVSSANTVTVLLQNLTGSAVDLSSGTLAVLTFTTA
jgi:hypothetical protein